MADEKVIIELDLVLANGTTQKAQAQIAKGFSKAGAIASTSFSERFKNGLAIGAGIKALSLIQGAARKVGQAFQEATDEMRQFGRGVAEINSILPQNQKLTKDATNQLIDFSSQFASKPREQARAFYNIVSAGVKGTANQLSTLQTANKTAVAGLVDIDTSAKVLVSSVNSYAKSGLTANEASDILFATVREGITTFGELSSFIGNVAPVAAAAGVSFSDLNGTLAAITKNGISTDVAVTGLRNVLTAIISPTKEASDEAKRLNLGFNAASLASDGLAGFLGKLEKATGGNTESLSKLFGNVRGLVPILSIVKGDFEGFKRTLDRVKDSAGSTESAFRILSETSDFQLRKLSSNIGNLLLSPLRDLDPVIAKVATAFNKAFGEVPSLDGVTRSIAAREKEIAAIEGQLKANSDLRKSLQATVSSYGNSAKEYAEAVSAFGKLTLSAKEERAELARLNQQRRDLIDPVGAIEREIASIEKSVDVYKKQLETITNLPKALTDNVNGYSNVGQAIEETNARSSRLTAEIKAQTDAISGLQLKRQELIDQQASEGEEDAGIDLLALAATSAAIGQIEAESNSLTSSLGGLFGSMSVHFDNSAKTMAKTAAALTKVFKQSLVNGIAGGVQNIVGSLMNGENAFKNFGKFVLGTFGEMATQMGAVLIAAGLGVESLKALEGGEAIAAGIGLVAVGTVISSLVGGGSSSSAATSSGVSSDISGATTSDDQLDTIATEETQEPATNIVINVDRIVDNATEGAFIVDLINEATDANNVTIRRNAIA